MLVLSFVVPVVLLIHDARYGARGNFSASLRRDGRFTPRAGLVEPPGTDGLPAGSCKSATSSVVVAVLATPVQM